MHDLRASDADRERSVEALRHHATAGRLTVEELDERTERAYAATPLRRPTMPGRLSPSARWHSPLSARATQAELIANLAPPLSRYGYDLIGREDGRLRFECERRPFWTFPVAIFLVPFGPLALLRKDRNRITIDLDDDEHGTTLVAIGVAPLAVRRAFAQLED
jgi:hypothetical protein